MDAGEKPASFYMRMFGSGSYSFRPVGCAARFKRMGRDAYQNMRGNEMPNDPYYQTAKHKAWKEKVLRRAGYLCEECRRYGRLGRDGLPVRATTAHHIKHRDEYPELQYDLSNGRALCENCHNKAHPEKGGARGNYWR